MNSKHTILLLSVLTSLINANPSQDKFVKATSNLTPAAKKMTISEATTQAINEARAKTQICAKAAPALKWNQGLYEIAKEHSIDMAVTGKLSHNGSGGPTDKTAKNLGLRRGSFFYERVNQKKDSKALLSGELLIRTDKSSLKSPKELINYWIKIPQDCKIIMDPRFTDVAMAKVISNKDNKAYWTLMLMGARKK